MQATQYTYNCNMKKKSVLKKLINMIFHPRKAFYRTLCCIPGAYKNDRLQIQRSWYSRMPYKLNLSNPQSYNEKLQWMKLYDHNPLYTTLVDKYAVKEYVANIIGREYIIPTLGVWTSFDEIDFDSLPDQFVLKCTHDSGGLVICKDKSNLDLAKAKLKIEESLQTDYYMNGREWPYKNVPRKIIAEKYMEDSKTGELRDYKFFCFDGKAKWLFIATDRQNREEPYFDFFDMDFNHLPMQHGHPNAPIVPEKPESFELMKKLAAKLSQGLTHVRVDFYEVDGKVYFGELTFFHHGGWTPFTPEKWDYIFGKEIVLPLKQTT